jgi:hypothetical protein
MLVEHSVSDIKGYAEQSGSLAHREMQPRHLPVLSVHTHRKRRHSFRGAGPVARASCVVFLTGRRYLNG